VHNRLGRCFELLPFEGAGVYEGMEVLPPTGDYPIRRYVPKRVDQFALDGIDVQERRGFVAETMALRVMIKGPSRPDLLARLEDSLAVTNN
jgi:hypothetical protein